MNGYPAVIARHVPARPEDAIRLRSLLTEPGSRGYFVFRRDLPEDVAEILDSLRVHGHPVVPLSYEAMLTAQVNGEEAGLLSELEHQYFDPQNLFLQRNAIHVAQFFFGRAALLTQVGSAMERGESVLLTGLRKSGKTSFLHILRQHLATLPWCALDMQSFNRAEDWVPFFFRGIIGALDRWMDAVFNTAGDLLPERGELPSTASEFREAMELRRGWMLERGRRDRFVIVMDEVERVFPQQGDLQAARTYERATGALRALAQAGTDRWVSLLVADLRPVANQKNVLPGGLTNPLFQMFQVLPLPLFTQDETEKMVRSIGRMMGIQKVEEIFLAALQDLTGGHPALARLVTARAFDLRREAIVLGIADYEAAMEKMEENWEIGFFFEENLWIPMEPWEQALLRVVVQTDKPTGRELPEGWAYGRPNWMAARAALTATGILAEGKVAIPGFQEYLREKFEDEVPLRGWGKL